MTENAPPRCTGRRSAAPEMGLSPVGIGPITKRSGNCSAYVVMRAKMQRRMGVKFDFENCHYAAMMPGMPAV